MIGKLTFDLAGEPVAATLEGDRWTVQCADPEVSELASNRLNGDFTPSRFRSPAFGFPGRAALSAAQQSLGGKISDLAPLPPSQPNTVY